jgi:hypothetical protein
LRCCQQAIADQGSCSPSRPPRTSTRRRRRLQRERETILLMHQGQHQWSPILSEAELQAQLHQWSTLTRRAAASSRPGPDETDQMLAWQGLPGSGKTFVLQAFKQSAAAQGFSVRGFAPSAEAANVLGKETGLPSATVASLLHSGKHPNGEHLTAEKSG